MASSMTAQRVELLSDIEKNKPVYIALLQDLIRAASPNPPGDTTKAAEVIKNYLRKHDLQHKIIAPLPHAPNVVADFKGGRGVGDRVILNGHIDTYPVERPDEWKHGPYSGYNDGVSIHGRGGVDMKAGIVASLIAFTLLSARAQYLNGSVGLVAASDEETGGKWGTRYLLEQCGHPSAWIGDCVLNGEPGGLQSIRFGEKGTLRLTFTIRCQGANGAYTFFTRGANIIAAEVITKLLEIETIEPDLPGELRKLLDSDRVRKVANEIMGDGAADVILKPSVNIGTMHGGVKVNTIPEQCVFEADIRLPIGLESKVILERIDQLIDGFPEVSYSIQDAASNPANYCPADHPFATKIKEVSKELTGLEPTMLTGLGGTDCKFYRYHGIPTYTYGLSPKGMGGSEEAVCIEEFITLVKTHTLAVWDYLTSPE